VVKEEMVSRVCLVGILFSFVVVLSSSSIPDYIRRGHFEGRSGNVVLSLKDSSPSILLMEQSHHHFDETIEDVNVVNLVAHVFQSVPPSNEDSPRNIDRSSFPVLSLFNAPAANLFITIEDIGKETLEKYPSLYLLRNRHQIEILPTYQSRDALSSLETLLTGVTPSQHGIVGRSWLGTSGTESTAFKDAGTGSHADSLFDVFAMTSSDSLIFSMASDAQMASSIGVRPKSRNSLPNVQTIYWNSKHQTFDSLNHRYDNNFQASRADILHSFRDKGFYNYEGIELVLDSKNMQLSVSVDSSVSSVPFDLNSEQDFRIFVETFFIGKTLRSLQLEPLSQYIDDEIPDSFAFAFAGMKSIHDKYGVDSPQFVASLHLLDRAVFELNRAISSLYGGRVSSQIICLKVPQNTPMISESLLHQFDEILPSVGDLVNYLPDIYMGNALTTGEERALVAQMNSLLSDEVVAYWFGRQDLHAQDSFLSGKRQPNERHEKVSDIYMDVRGYLDGPATFGWNVRSWFGFPKKDRSITYTLNEVNIFQICLWSGVALMIIACGGCCAMCALNPEKNNELLYLQTALGRETDTIPGGDYDFKPM